MSAARDEILRRVRLAAVARRPEPVERTYRRRGRLEHAERVALFCERVGEYRAEVHRCGDRGVAALVGELCAVRGARRLVVAPGLTEVWRSGAVEFVVDEGPAADELDALDGALTGCATAIAETGTVVLTSPADGRRATTLVPDLHICIVREAQIVELLPEALERLVALGADRAPITFVSGPSATSDIELSRVEGVHGPRNLVVVVVKESS